MNENKKITIFSNAPVTLRITALWAFSEAFLGGILHGLKVPFAGLFLALIASVCMTIIASATVKKGELIKATLLVLAVKFLLSPHTPLPAYLAVFIQGLVGELLFLNRKMLKPSAFLLSVFCLTYSAFQHLLLLTILFGNEWWSAVDIFLNKITKSFVNGTYQYSFYIIIIYFSCYFIAGIVGGILNLKIIQKIKKGGDTDLLKVWNEQYSITEGFDNTQAKAPKKRRTVFIIVGLLAFMIMVTSYLPFFKLGFSKDSLTELILRALIILVVWNLFLTPLLRKGIKKWFEKYQQKNKGSLQQIVALLPEIRQILQASWKFSNHSNKWIRVKNFISTSVLLIAGNEQ